MTTLVVLDTRAGTAPVPRPSREFERHAAWYLAAGVLTTLAQLLVFLGLQAAMGSYVANLLAIALTTVANTEFHRRITFADSPSRPARRHLQTVLSFVFYAGYGSAVLLLVQAFVADPTPIVETVALAIASFLGGVARFFLLRAWVFVRQDNTAQGVTAG